MSVPEATIHENRPSTELPQLPRIRPLAYFMPVVEELQLQPLPDGYVDYLRLKLQRLARNPA
ncbi:MAG: hypothetical protein ACR2NN_27580 [Bryobacteraceae bacterium]